MTFFEASYDKSQERPVVTANGNVDEVANNINCFIEDIGIKYVHKQSRSSSAALDILRVFVCSFDR